MSDLTPCQEHVQMLRTSGLFAAGARSLWDTDTDKPDAAQRQAIADAKAGCLDCPAFDACRLKLDARMRDGEDVTGIVAGTDRRDRDGIGRPARQPGISAPPTEGGVMRHHPGCPDGPDCELSEEPTFWGGEETVCLTHESDHPEDEDTVDA